MVNEAVDPYARALTANGGVRGVVVDLDMTDPEGWENDIRPPFGAATDAIIYEVHVRDFTSSPDSGGYVIPENTWAWLIGGF